MDYIETDIEGMRRMRSKVFDNARGSFFGSCKLALSLFLGACLLAGLASCGNKSERHSEGVKEDVAAKKMLQGIWLNDDDEDDVAFRVKGDTIYYPDSTSQPVYFYIAGDTLVMKGANVSKYPIVKQAAHIFQFKVQNGDVVKLVKTNDESYLREFTSQPPVALNQNTLIKRDTVVNGGEEKLHLYVQVNPTSYKVFKSSYNDDGVEVDNVYYDNIVNVNVFHGARKIFGRDFHKEDFKHAVPQEFLKQAILSDIVFLKVDADGVHYKAVLAMPDSSMSYQVELVISLEGKLQIKRS